MKRVFVKNNNFSFDVYTNSVKLEERTITYTLGANPEIILVSEFADSISERIEMVKTVCVKGTSPLFLGQFPDERLTMAYSLAWNDALVKKCYGKVRDKEFILITVKDRFFPSEDEEEEIEAVSTHQRFVVFSAGGNSRSYIGKHIRSVVRQNYSNYLHVVVDDATTDGTSKVIERLAHPKMVSYRNKRNMKWVWNALKYIPRHIKSDEDVVVIVDMDDWLANKRALTILANAYEKEKCWVTYGSFTYDNHVVHSRHRKIYSPQVVRDRTFRKVPWMWWHPKTFKFFLFDAIKKRDLYAPDGGLPLFTYDKAIGFPMLEMTPPEKLCYISDMIYVYNVDNPIRSSRMFKHAGGLGKWYRGKEPYEILNR